MNKRNPEKLLASFKKWYEYNERFYKYSPDILTDKSDEALIELFNRHYYNIETFFSTEPSAKFITFDIENDSIDKLKKYIDLKNITVFPKENVNLKP